MNNITKTIFLILKLALGLFIVLYVLYRRLYLVRLPKDLYIITNNQIKITFLVIIWITVIILAYIIYQNISILYNKKVAESYLKKKMLQISTIIENAIDKSLYELYYFIGYILDKTYFRNSSVSPYDIISYISRKFYKYFSKQPEYYLLFILYFIRFVILLCFLIDVFIYFRLELMYKSLYLLCISLLIKLLLFILRDFASNLELIRAFLIIEDSGINEESGLPLTTYSFKEEYQKLNPSLDYYAVQFILIQKVSGYLEMYDRYSRYFSPRFNILICLLYLLGWLYVLYINF